MLAENCEKPINTNVIQTRDALNDIFWWWLCIKDGCFIECGYISWWNLAEKKIMRVRVSCVECEVSIPLERAVLRLNLMLLILAPSDRYPQCIDELKVIWRLDFGNFHWSMARRPPSLEALCDKNNSFLLLGYFTRKFSEKQCINKLYLKAFSKASFEVMVIMEGLTWTSKFMTSVITWIKLGPFIKWDVLIGG